MEMCTTRGISNLPSIQPTGVATKHIQSVHGKSWFPYITKQVGFNSGLRHFSKLSRVSFSEGNITETTPYDKGHPESDDVVIVEDTLSDYSKGDYDTNLNEVAQEGSLVDHSLQLLKFMNFYTKFDFEDTYPVLILGGAALSLWLAAAVVGAVDSIPLLPKLLELIGLGYTVWFSSRYLIFKENRHELIAGVEQIKQDVLGSKDD